jgi:flavin reductase (DIM6/NTAB) family NADH-FMN oxidoreductase RutF
MFVNESIFRQTMRFWTTGVTVVTSNFDGNRHGMTVSSFTSVTVEPPVVLVSINQNTRTYQLMKLSGVFAVTILEKSQQTISNKFAGLIPEENDRFAGIETHTLVTGAPLISGGIAFLDCKITQAIDVGHNTVFFGEVLDAGYQEGFKPLLYSNRTYGSLQK